MMITLNIDVPEPAGASLGEDPERHRGRLLLAAAAKWYELGWISQGRAAEIAGISRAEFIGALGEFGVSPFQAGAEELERELAP